MKRGGTTPLVLERSRLAARVSNTAGKNHNSVRRDVRAIELELRSGGIVLKQSQKVTLDELKRALKENEITLAHARIAFGLRKSCRI